MTANWTLRALPCAWLLLWALSAIAGLCAEPKPAVSGAGVVTIPFEYEDNLIWVKALGNGRELDFIFDSGSGLTYVAEKTAERLGLKFGRTGSIHGVERIVRATDVGDFSVSLGGIPLKHVPALDLPERRNRSLWHWHRRRQADGLIGQEFFRGRVVEIDYRRKQIRVLEQPEAGAGASILPIRFHKDAMVVPVSVNGLAAQWARLDTGCATALEWSGDVLDPTLSRNLPTGLVFETTVKLGDRRVLNVKVNLHAQSIFPPEAGLLGNGVLSRYRVTIDGRRLLLLLE